MYTSCTGSDGRTSRSSRVVVQVAMAIVVVLAVVVVQVTMALVVVLVVLAIIVVATSINSWLY